MRDYLANEVRNTVVLGHSGAGKSTVIEACLFYTKAIDSMRRNNDGTTVLNFDPEEGKRGLSVYCHLAPVEWKNKKINFIDTPGYMDYEGEEAIGLATGDNALIVVNGKEGIEAGTERAWKEAVVKRKKLEMKPMSEEEAVLEMELLGHNFFVYKDRDSGSVNVIYKRKDGNYGIIETN